MQKTPPVEIGILIGSLRAGSLSRSITKALIERAPGGSRCTIIEIGDLPLYNEDLDARPPAAWVRFREAIAACDALLFVTPEYNRSVPGCLKNATDIGSRPEGSNVFDALPAAIVSVTPYSLGAFGANHALRQSFVYLNLRVMQQPEAYIGNASDLLGAGGKVTDKKAGETMAAFMAAFGEWIDMTTSPGDADFASFMAEREAGSVSYVNGDDAPLQAMATKVDPASFFPPSGDRVVGAANVSRAHHEGAKAFLPGSTGGFDILQSGSSGKLAFWTGVQNADAMLKGKDGDVHAPANDRGVSLRGWRLEARAPPRRHDRRQALMRRETFRHDGVTLSYLDPGGDGVPIVALHAYWMEAGTYADLAAALAPEWRVIALDQRGHGHSDHPADLSWDAFIGDLGAFLDHLGITGPVILAGNSLGGTVAFRYAARNPGRVSAMIVEESPAEEDADLDFMRAWEGAYPTRDALAAKIGERLSWSVEPSFRYTDAGWTLAFSPTRLADAQAGLNGDFWEDWLATECPVLLVRGTDSKAVDGTVLEEMAKRRTHTTLLSLDAGHVTHHDRPAEFAAAVRHFLVSGADQRL